MAGPFKNTDKLLHENVDCRIHITEQHQLGIDVKGTVIVRDPLDWHRLAKLEDAVYEMLNTEGALLSQENQQRLESALAR